jgi:hypothetical protein
MLTTTGGRDARAYYALLLRSTVKERSIFVLIRLSCVNSAPAPAYLLRCSTESM